MVDGNELAAGFEVHRPRLQAVAYRVLGTVGEAEDAVQEAWLRASRADIGDVHNVGAWLTTVVARVALNMLQSRAARREEPLEAHLPDPVVTRAEGSDPEQQAVLADAVGLAMLVVLDTLAPTERVAFVLHDMFGVPFDEIAAMVQRSPVAARQLASRARRRVRAASTPETDLARQRQVVDAFVAAASDGDFEALLAVLDPRVVLRADAGLGPASRVVSGASAVARQALAFAGRREHHPVLVNGGAGVLVVDRERPLAVLGFTIAQDTIIEIDVLADLSRLQHLDLPYLNS